MGILRRLREWREDKNGTLIGPNIDADSVDAESVNTDALSHDLENAQDLGSERTSGTWYQNQSGRTQLVSVDYSVNPSSGTSIIRIQFHLNNDSTNDNVVDTDSVTGTKSELGIGGPTYIVPEGAYYKVEIFGDTADASLSGWREARYQS